jgi:hypothetical protein
MEDSKLVIDQQNEFLFSIKAVAESHDVITNIENLICSTLFYELNDETKVLPDDQIPLLWQIVHHSTMTKNILRALEEAISNLAFLYHIYAAETFDYDDNMDASIDNDGDDDDDDVYHEVYREAESGKNDDVFFHGDIHRALLEQLSKYAFHSSLIANFENSNISKLESFPLTHHMEKLTLNATDFNQSPTRMIFGVNIERLCKFCSHTKSNTESNMYFNSLKKSLHPLSYRLRCLDREYQEMYDIADYLRMQESNHNSPGYGTSSYDQFDTHSDDDDDDGKNIESQPMKGNRLFEMNFEELSKEHQLESNSSASISDMSTRSNLDRLYSSCKVKIADLGNACWIDKQFTPDIQTRQYRAPEVTLQAKYGTSADMWSLACLVFELLTGDYLFDPQQGKNWSREEDHLALIIELLGPISKNLLAEGKLSSTYFNRQGQLRHIHNLNPWPLSEVLVEKYGYSTNDATAVSGFVNPLLQVRAYLHKSKLLCRNCIFFLLYPYYYYFINSYNM